MRMHDEAKGNVCKRIFCCGECRQKHQLAAHAIAVRQPLTDMNKANNSSTTTTIYVYCPICEEQPLLLHRDIYAELLEHIESAHLPLHCRKCLRHYTKIEDLYEFSKCVDVSQNCSASTDQTNASKATIKPAASTISTQTSPMLAKDMNETQHLTPISLMNLRWKAKGKLVHEFISDSVSSIPNLSSLCNSSLRRSITQLAAPPETARKGKLIRSTSTPLQMDAMFAKPKEPPTFNASQGGHMSSIYHSGYVDAEQNSAAAQLEAQPPPQQLQQRAWKLGARSKMSAVTPLRQVMSKRCTSFPPLLPVPRTFLRTHEVRKRG